MERTGQSVTGNREMLRRYLGQRLPLCARLVSYGRERSGDVALCRPVTCGPTCLGHCWLQDAGSLRDAGIRPGQWFFGTALVESYGRGFGLTLPADITLAWQGMLEALGHQGAG